MSDDDALALRDDAREQMLRVQLELLSRAMDLPDTPELARGRHGAQHAGGGAKRLSASLHCASLHSVKSAPDLQNLQSLHLAEEHGR